MDGDSDPQQSFIELIDEPYEQVSIKVVEGITRGHGISNYVGYVIKVTTPIKITVQRRYRQFDALREVLVMRWPGVVIPCLPRKHNSGSNSLKVVNERVKYLTYFLNNCAKQNFIFMSDQFQFFLTSPNSDLKKHYQKSPKLAYKQILVRYESNFSEFVAQQSKRAELTLLIKDNIDPFMKELQQKHISLINIKKEFYKLALRKEQYLKSMGVLLNEALPALQNHLQNNVENPSINIIENENIKQIVKQIRIEKAKVYWILYQALKLQINEAQSAVEALQSRINTERDQERISRKIVTNEEELANITKKKLTLKQFFTANNDQLIRDIEQQNAILVEQKQSLRILTLIVNRICIERMITQYREKRQEIWMKVFSIFAKEQIESNNMLQDLYKIVSNL